MLLEFCLHRFSFKSYRHFYATKSVLFCPIVVLNLDFSCHLSERTNENIFGSNQAIRKNSKVA